MRLKQRPEDFVVREAYRFEERRRGEHYVYLMDKQKLSTLEAVERVAEAHGLEAGAISFCGLKDKQGRTEQLIAVRGQRVDLQSPQLRLKFLGRTAEPLSAANLRANRFVVTVRDLTMDEAERVPASVGEVKDIGVINYFDSQRFGSLKHGRGFLAKDLLHGRVEQALRGYLATPSRLDRTEDAKVKAFWDRNWGQWNARCPYGANRRYRRVLARLRRSPQDFAGAFAAIDKRYRGLLLFEYQSYLWNLGVAAYLEALFGKKKLLALKYQAGRQLFPRLTGERQPAAGLSRVEFPLLGPETVLEDEAIAAAVRGVLRREKLDLEALALDAVPGMGFRGEPRAMAVRPRRLSVVDPRPDELHPGRLKITLAFTLPPGAYASLVVRRVMWFADSHVGAHGGPIPEPEPDFVPEALRRELHSRASKAVHRRNRRPRPVRGITAEKEKPPRGGSRKRGRPTSAGRGRR